MKNKTLQRGAMFVILGIILMLGVVGWYLYLYPKLPLKLPWFYSNPWGETQLIEKQIFGIVMVAEIVVSLGFYWWSTKFVKLEKTLVSIINGAVFMATMMIFLSAVRVLLIFS